MAKWKSTEGKKGMVKDLEASKTPANYLEFALNAVKDNTEGGLGSIHTEGGCEEQLQASYVIGGVTYSYVGHISMTPNEKILFLWSTNKEMIASFQKGVIKSLLELTGTERFNFHPDKPIQGVGHIRRGSEKIIYWNDTSNPDRVLNLSQLQNYRNTAGAFVTNLTLFNKQFNIPKVEMVSENDSGGRISLGTYRISLYYVDKLNNKSEVFYISNQIQVARGVSTTEDWRILGGHNKASNNWTNATTAYDPVNKSFSFRFTGIDTNYEKLAIVVSKYDDGFGAVSGTFLVDELTISDNTTINWDFVGIQGDDTSVDYSTITASYARYETCQYMVHIQNRLIKANLTENIYDWAKVQRFALAAQVKWVTKPLQANRNTFKQAKSVFEDRSLMRDEIASIGFTLQMVDGQESPVIHIPGRAEITAVSPLTINGVTYTNLTGNGQSSRGTVGINQSWDKNPITPVAGNTGTANTTPIAGVRHLNAVVGTPIERWKVWNTAIVDTASNTETGYVGSGIMGFHEDTNATYPLVRDGDGEIIYPHTVVGTTVTMHKIRHHRIPHCELAPIGDMDVRSYAGTYDTSLTGNHFVYPIGIRIYNLNIPPEILPFVKGIRIYFGDRTNNKTIREKGYGMGQHIERISGLTANPADYWLGRWPAFPASEGGAVETHTNLTGTAATCTGVNYISHNCLAGYPQFTSQYIHQEATAEMTTSSIFDHVQDDIGVAYYRHQFNNIPKAFVNNLNAHHLSSPINGEYAEAPYSSAQSFSANGNTQIITNVGYSQKAWIINTRDGLQSYPGTGADASRWNGRFFHNALSDGINYSGSTTTRMMYVSLKDSKDVYSNLEGIQYIPSTDSVLDIATTYDAMGTHNYIGTLYHFSGWYWYQFSALRHMENYHTGMYAMFLESEHNIDMRGAGGDDRDEFFPQRNDLNYFLRSHHGETNTYHKDDFTLRDMRYHYNGDYSIQKHPTPKSGISNSISWSNEERGRFPDRIIWSAKSNDEEITDANLLFAALDYDDLSLDKGEIRMLAQKPNMLYAMTDWSVFGKPTNAQGIEASNSTLFLKNSKFLDIPETELYDTGSGYGGCQSRFAGVNTEFGTLYVNQLAGEVYLLNKGVENLSLKGLGKDLKNRLPSNFLYEFRKAIGADYPYKDHTTLDDTGIGTRVHYDPIQKRAIITKIDYEMTLPLKLWDGVTAQGTTDIWWNASTKKLMFNGVNVNPRTDDVRFRKRNLTISYDFVEKRWISYHSWIPKTGWNDTENLYTIPVNTAKTFKHVEHNYLKYYDNTRSPFIIEFITPNFERATGSQINWLTSAGTWSDTHNTYLPQIDETFTKAYVYSDFNTSGLMELVNLQANPFGWTGLANQQRAITRYNNIWRLNNIWDMRHVSHAIQPAMTEDWNNATYKAFFTTGTTQGFIDKVPNAASYDFTKSKFQIPLVDNSKIHVRLIYDNQTDNNKLTVNLMSLFKQQDLI